MKRMKDILAIAALLLVMASCGKKEEVSLSPSTVSFTPDGGTVEVTLASTGDWQVENQAEWLSVTPTSGNGNATLSVTANANDGNESREAQVKVSTKDKEAFLTVQQDFSESPFLKLQPNEIQCDRFGGTFGVVVSSNIDWQISMVPEGLTVSVTSGTGNGTVSLTIAPIEGDDAERHYTLMFSGGNILAPLSITQSNSSGYDVIVAPSSLSFGYEGGNQSVEVTCAGGWQIETSAEWVSMGTMSGNGDAEIVVTAAENDQFEPREAFITFASTMGAASMVVHVSQEAAPDPHFLEISNDLFNVSKTGGVVTLSIGCDTEWNIMSECSWVTIDPLTGSGNGTVNITVDANALAVPRSMSFVVESGSLREPVTVEQEAGDTPLFVTLSPDTLWVPYTGSTSALIEVTSNTSWNLRASDWISNLPSGVSQGDGSVYLIIDQNSDEATRYGSVSALHFGEVMDEIVVVQEGKPDLLEVNGTEFDVRPEGQEFTFHITSNQAWVIQTDVMWFHVNPTSGFANADVTVTVDAMSSTQPREGHITIKAASGKIVVITVTQHW